LEHNKKDKKKKEKKKEECNPKEIGFRV